MYDGNPEEIDFGSSYREVRVSEGSSYWESTVHHTTTLFLHLIRGPIKWIAALIWSLVNSPTASHFVPENASRNYLNYLTSLA